MLPADYCICTAFQVHLYPSPSFVGHLTKLNRPSALYGIFFTREAKFSFLEGHLHYPLSWGHPWKTCEVFGVPKSFPSCGSPAAVETPTSALPLMLPPPAPGSLLARKQEIWIPSPRLPLENDASLSS